MRKRILIFDQQLLDDVVVNVTIVVVYIVCLFPLKIECYFHPLRKNNQVIVINILFFFLFNVSLGYFYHI